MISSPGLPPSSPTEIQLYLQYNFPLTPRLPPFTSPAFTALPCHPSLCPSKLLPTILLSLPCPQTLCIIPKHKCFHFAAYSDNSKHILFIDTKDPSICTLRARDIELRKYWKNAQRFKLQKLRYNS